MGKAPTVARAALHLWEEPCLSGGNGSGTVFFSGCNLGCVYCQNYPISRGQAGKEITKARLSEIFRELVEKGADNINLVTPTHFSDVIAETLRAEKPPVPFVWNCGGYESVDTLKTLEGLIDVYMPDMKYADPYIAARQRGRYVLDDRGLIKSGVMIRHLILPGNLDNTFRVIDWVAETFRPGQVLFSLMSQFTPTENCAAFPEINRPLSEEEHEKAIGYLESSGIEDGFYQDLGSVGESFIPPFDLTGV